MEPSSNMQVSITDLLRMTTTPLGRRYSQRRLFNGGRAPRKAYVRAADRAEPPISASAVCRRGVMAG